MRRIESGERLLAVIISSSDFRPGTNFLSEPGWPLQVGLLEHASGYTIPAHRHREHPERLIVQTQEFLLVLDGSMEVRFYDEGDRLVQTEVVRSGEAVLYIAGGHAFRFLAASRVIEIKQGPYMGVESDKHLIKSP